VNDLFMAFFSIVLNAVTILEHLTGLSPQPTRDLIASPHFQHILSMLMCASDRHVFVSLSLIHYMTTTEQDDSDGSIADTLLGLNIMHPLHHVCYSAQVSIRSLAFSVIGNLFAGSVAQCDIILNSGILPTLHTALSDTDAEILVEVLRALTNLSYGATQHKRLIFKEGIIPAVCAVLAGLTFESRVQALLFFVNMARYGRDEARRGKLAGVMESATKTEASEDDADKDFVSDLEDFCVAMNRGELGATPDGDDGQWERTRDKTELNADPFCDYENEILGQMADDITVQLIVDMTTCRDKRVSKVATHLYEAFLGPFLTARSAVVH
jgi:hypothetical protein